jgi:hypothetical protein
MVLGHYAVGIALKRVEPRLSLGMLLLGVNLIDITFGILMLAGVEHARFVPTMAGIYPYELYDFPYSHSMAGGIALSLLGFLLYQYWPVRTGSSRLRPALIFGAAIFSHFLCDIISHRPDLPLFGDGSPRIGMGLYGSMAGSVALEGVLFVLGLYWYQRAVPLSSSIGRPGFVCFIATMLTVYFWTMVDAPLRALHYPASPEMKIAILLFLGNLLFVAAGMWLENSQRKESRAGGI